MERVLLPSAVSADAPPVEVPILRRFDQGTGSAWIDRIDQTDEIRIIELAGELENLFGGHTITKPIDFYDALKAYRYEFEGEERTGLMDADEAFSRIRCDARVDLFDIWLAKVYSVHYIDLTVEQGIVASDAVKKIPSKMKLTKGELAAWIRRDGPSFLKNLFLEWQCANKKGEVEAMILHKALGKGDLQAAMMFRQGFNARRSTLKTEHHETREISFNIDQLSESELKEMIKRQKKLLGHPVGEPGDDERQEGTRAGADPASTEE